MAVVGFNLKKIFVERKKLTYEGIKVNTKINILNLEKEETKLVSEKDILNFEFEFEIIYNSTSNSEVIAQLIFNGNLLYLIDSKDAKKIIDLWKKKELDEELRLKILNSIFARCNTKALLLEEEMGLPPHIPLPRISKSNKEKENKTK